MSSFSSSLECQSKCLPDCDIPLFHTYQNILTLDSKKECEDPIVMEAALKNIKQSGDRSAYKRPVHLQEIGTNHLARQINIYAGKPGKIHHF